MRFLAGRAYSAAAVAVLVSVTALFLLWKHPRGTSDYQDQELVGTTLFFEKKPDSKRIEEDRAWLAISNSEYILTLQRGLRRTTESGKLGVSAHSIELQPEQGSHRWKFDRVVHGGTTTELRLRESRSWFPTNSRVIIFERTRPTPHSSHDEDSNNAAR